MLLINHKAIQFNEGHFRGNDVESIADERILKQPGKERLVFRIHFDRRDGRIISAIRLRFFEADDALFCGLPFLNERCGSRWLDCIVSNKPKKLLSSRPAKKVQEIVRFARFCTVPFHIIR